MQPAYLALLTMAQEKDMEHVKALFFDVFGTLVDWRSSIAREARAILSPLDVAIDWEKFADAWRGEYRRWTRCAAAACRFRSSTTSTGKILTSCSDDSGSAASTTPRAPTSISLGTVSMHGPIRHRG